MNGNFPHRPLGSLTPFWNCLRPVVGMYTANLFLVMGFLRSSVFHVGDTIREGYLI